MTQSVSPVPTVRHAVPAGRRGFTLIELMIAIALSMAILYVAMAGFRVASQSITAVNRMATENRIIRAGLSLAMDDTDFWSSHDDPFDAGNAQARQPLRAAPVSVNGEMRGLPFTSFALAQASGTYPHVTDTYDPRNPTVPANLRRVGNPNAWMPSESRGWAWVNLAERVPVSTTPGRLQTFGNYYQFASTASSSPHQWQQRQLDGLNKAVGYYGMFDYLPPNTPLSLYAQSPAGAWSVSGNGASSNGNNPFYLGNDNRLNGLNFAQDMLSATYGFPFIIPSPRDPSAALVPAAYQRFSTGISLSTSDNTGSINMIASLLQEGTVQTDWLPDRFRPATWPSLSVSSLRYVLTNSFVCLNRIRWTSPLTVCRRN